MNKKETALAAVLEQKMLPLYFHESADVSVRLLETLYAAGVHVVEYTNRGEAALKNFSQLRKAVDDRMPGMQLAIGTIKNKAAAEAFIAAGADFIICPSINEEVGEAAAVANRLWIPGCMTATEIARAENAGASLVKIFPGSLLGPSYITAIRDIFPGLRFVVTGGVEAEEANLKGWFKAGVAGVGLGSKLLSKELIEKGDYHQIEQNIRQALALVKSIAG